jgi:hypothetical protein
MAKARRAEALFSTRTQEWLRGSPRYRVNAGTIPAELIRPLIEEAFETGNQYAIEEMAGLPTRSLVRVLRENHSGVTFEVADAIVTGVVGAGRWQEPPLRSWYWANVLGR